MYGVSKISSEQDILLTTFPGAKYSAQSLAGYLKVFADAGIVVDMICQSAPRGAAVDFSFTTANAIAQILSIMCLLNINLAVFNLIPIPPLDGSRIVTAVLPANLYYKIMQYERYIILAVFLILFLGWLDGPLAFLRSAVFHFLDTITAFLG